MEKTAHKRTFLGIIVFILLLLTQIFLGKTGHLIAKRIPYQSIDPFDCFVEISIHHAVELLIALAIILMLSKLLTLDFYFQLGDKKKGTKYLTVFTAVFAVITIAKSHTPLPLVY